MTTSDVTPLKALERLNRQAGHYYFSAGALEFFGSTQRSAVRLPDGGFLYTELRQKAPEGAEWIAVRFGADGLDYEDATGATRSAAIQALRVALRGGAALALDGPDVSI
jgi:hypothetical protein